MLFSTSIECGTPFPAHFCFCDLKNWDMMCIFGFGRIHGLSHMCHKFFKNLILLWFYIKFQLDLTIYFKVLLSFLFSIHIFYFILVKRHWNSYLSSLYENRKPWEELRKYICICPCIICEWFQRISYLDNMPSILSLNLKSEN